MLINVLSVIIIILKGKYQSIINIDVATKIYFQKKKKEKKSISNEIQRKVFPETKSVNLPLDFEGLSTQPSSVFCI